MGIVDGDLTLYPGRDVIRELRLYAERAEEDNADEEAVQRAMVERGKVMAAQAAKLYRDMLNLQGEVVMEVNGAEVRDFDSIMTAFHAWRYLTPLPKLNETYETSEVAYQCSCEVGQKRGICKHALVHTHYMKLCCVPEAFEQGTTYRRRKPGRPRKTRGALERQPGEVLTVADLLPPRMAPRLEGQESPVALSMVRKSTRERRAVTFVDV